MILNIRCGGLNPFYGCLMVSLIEFIRRIGLLFAWQVLKVYTPPDRDLLENRFFPHYRDDPDIHRILLVGVGAHLRHYPDIFRGKEVVTLDSKPGKQRFGAGRHIVDDLRNLSRHCSAEYFDLIVLNGIFGWGVDAKSAEEVMSVCCRHLTPRGRLLVGYNEQRPEVPAPETFATFPGFKPVPLPTLDVDRWVVEIPFKEKTHTYLHLQKT